MHQLLNNLVTSPLIFNITIIVLIIILIPLAILANVYHDKNPYNKNPFVTSLIITIITLLTISIGVKIRTVMIYNKPQEYVTIQKKDNNVIIKSKTMFINNVTLPIKEHINNGIIVEYDENEYVIRNNQLNYHPVESRIK